MLRNLNWSCLVLENINIAINHEELEQKDHAKYLNIFIDKNLSWRKQIESTT